MAILRRQFYRHEKGNREERFCYLATNTETNEVYVIEGYFPPSGGGGHEIDIPLVEFLGEGGSAQSELKKLIATLIVTK
ncbi:hypothetical protein [Rhizobium leguminosarum]